MEAEIRAHLAARAAIAVGAEVRRMRDYLDVEVTPEFGAFLRRGLLVAAAES